MSRKKRTYFQDTAEMRIRWYNHYYNRLYEIAISSFDYENIPDSIDVRFLEDRLFHLGSVVWFKDENLILDSTTDSGILALPIAMSGTLNVYNIPMGRRAYASNGYNKSLNQNNSVIMWNNYAHTNTAHVIDLYAKELAEVRMNMMVNVNAQKTPVMVQTSEKQRLTLINLYQKYEGNEPFIMGDKSLDMNALKVLKTDAPYVADKLYQLLNQIWNEALTYLGISNVNFQKKERMVTDEVIRSQGGTIASRYSRLKARRDAIDKINEMFSLDITVDYAQDYREADDEVMLSGETEDKKGIDMVTDLRTNSGRGSMK